MIAPQGVETKQTNKLLAEARTDRKDSDCNTPDAELSGDLLVGLHVEALHVVRLVDHSDKHRMECYHNSHRDVQTKRIAL